MSGEIHSDEHYSCEKSDVWSLAVTIFIIYFGTRPYTSVLPTFLDDEETPFYGEWLTMIYDKDWKAYWTKTRLKHNHMKMYDRYITKFMERTLLKDPKSRPSIEMLMFDDLFLGPCMKRVEVVNLMRNVEHYSPL
jgi:serine/threonine protein kinase